MQAPLTVYRASAGSGKTFTLAVEYISLLIRNPKAYEHILAVTFTNKATEEMKMRIISQLYGISHELHDSMGYLQKVMEKTGMERKQVVERAGIALQLLIHNYNYFRVQTIDAFFQTVLRNLARELELTANLRVDLNDRQVEEQAVDEMIESLDSDARVLNWIHDYIDKNIKEDLNWNVIGDIKRFGMNIFKDFYKKHSDELDKLMKSDKFFESYTHQLRQRRDTIQNDRFSDAKRMLLLLKTYGFDDPSYYKFGDKGTVLKYITTQATQKKFDNSPTPARVQDFIDDPEKMAANHPDRQRFLQFAESQLIPKLKAYEEKRKKGWFAYQSALLTLRHLSQLRLLHAIAAAVDSINSENNRFQLSNTQSLLNALIKDSDSPFIFEKIGAQLKHIMIDEFQDTSRIQWENFKVLLGNCMAQEGSHDLIVGDVKQSIYRWRSGDWRLLNDIESEFAAGQIVTEPLKTNYRSDQLVVEFNNAFFRRAVEVTLSELENDKIEGFEQLAKAYQKDDLEQLVHKQNRQGYIHVELLPSKDYREQVMERLLDNVDRLLGQGVRLQDIAILVRANSEAQSIADLFMQERPQLRLVSDEAFRLDASLTVNIIISALRAIIHPDDILTKAQLAKAYHMQVLGEDMSDADLFVGKSVNELLPADFLQDTNLKTMPIADLTDRIYDIFQLRLIKHQSAYVCAFYDVLTTFMKDNTSSIDFFLREWDENLHEKTIQSDETDGIRIITIHKSKGLEFDHVLIPFCDWQLERSPTIWCERKSEDPFDKLPIIPIDFSKNSMTGTVYEADYKEEHLQNVVDNMNLLYVAFTRAGKSLIITGKRMSKNRIKAKAESITSFNRSEVIEESLPKLQESLEGSILSGLDKQDEPIVFHWESAPASTSKEKDGAPTTNVFLTPVVPHTVQIETFRSPVEFRQSDKSREFVSSDDEDAPSLTYIKLGNILHSLFSTIRTIDDIEPKLRELELEGIIYDDEVSAEEIRQKLNLALQDTQVRSWFDPKWQVFNECAILEKQDGKIPFREYRPDRVISDGNQMIVIDFKFGAPHSGYRQQVKNYMRLLHQMGHHQVKGYLWYVLRQQVEEV